jgi:integrase
MCYSGTRVRANGNILAVPLERWKGRRASGDHGESTPQAGRPSNLKRTVAPRRPPNRDLRTREHLTEAEVERLMDAAKGNRYGNRDATMVLVAYRHGLRASELVDLRWDQVDFRNANH